MTGLRTLLFISVASMRNLVLRQLARVRQPRYLAASAMGLFYFWSIFARYGRRPPHGLELQIGASLLAAGLLALSLLITIWTWAFGGDEGSLNFAEAEIQFLFPAPLTRQTLVHYKLSRTLLLSSVTAGFLTLGLGHKLGVPAGRFFFGAWLGVATVGLHNIAASLTRASLLQHGARGLIRRIPALLIPLAIGGSIAFSLWTAPFPQTVTEIPAWFTGLLGQGPLHWVSLPFRPALEVALGVSSNPLPVALAAALVSLGVHYVWAMNTDANFQDSSLASAERRGRRIEQRRRGQLPLRAARAPFRLAPTGRPAMAILWKNLTAAVRLLSLRMGVILALSVAAFSIPVLMFHGSAERQTVAAAALVMLAGYFTIFGTQIYRIDFRLDLANIDMLRTLPLRGWEIALGEVLAPVLVIAAAQWLCLACATAVVPADALFHLGRLAPAIALGMVLPPVNLCLVIVQNAGVLLFPAWVAGGVQGPRGIEAMGQRMLTLVGTLLAALVALVPAGIISLVGLLFAILAHAPSLGLLVGAAAGSVVLVIEAGFGVMFLGRCFERFDLGQA